VLSYRGQGRPQNITPSPERVSAVQKLTDDYRQFRQARSQLLRLQRQIVELIDGIEAARVQEGERRFQKLRASFAPHSRR
jgi:TolA-binding protein